MRGRELGDSAFHRGQLQGAVLEVLLGQRKGRGLGFEAGSGLPKFVRLRRLGLAALAEVERQARLLLGELAGLLFSRPVRLVLASEFLANVTERSVEGLEILSESRALARQGDLARLCAFQLAAECSLRLFQLPGEVIMPAFQLNLAFLPGFQLSGQGLARLLQFGVELWACWSLAALWACSCSQALGSMGV